MTFSRRTIAPLNRSRVHAPITLAQLTARPLLGPGPAITISGNAPVPLSISATVSAGVLGVGLVTLTANGVAILTAAVSAASMPLTGILAGLTLALAAGPYAGEAYTLVLP